MPSGSISILSLYFYYCSASKDSCNIFLFIDNESIVGFFKLMSCFKAKLPLVYRGMLQLLQLWVIVFHMSS